MRVSAKAKQTVKQKVEMWIIRSGEADENTDIMIFLQIRNTKGYR